MIPQANPDYAWEEFSSTRMLGQSSVQLLIKLTAQVTSRTSFPPPPQHRAWNQDAILDFIGGMVEGKKGIQFVISAALNARDQASFERQLLASIENWLKDQSKMTLVGRMRRRLVTLLDHDSRFDRASAFVGADAWTLPVLGVAVWQGDPSALYESTNRRDDDGLTELNTAGKASANNIRVLTGYAHHLLATALGALRDQLMARFIVQRYQLDEPDVLELRDDLPNAESSRHIVEDQILILDAKEAIVAVLDGRDQVILALWEQPETLALRLHLSKSEAQIEIDLLLEKLQPLALGTDIGLEALRLVMDECSQRA